MDPLTLLHKSRPLLQETSSSSGSAPAQYEPPPSQQASSSPRSASAPNVSLPPPSTAPSSPRASPSPASACAPCESRPPSSPLPSHCIKIEGTSEGSSVTRSDEVQTGGATATGDHTISDAPPAQDRTLSLPRSASTTSAPSLPHGAVAGARPSTFWRFILPMTNPTLPITNPQPVRRHTSSQGRLLPDGVIQVRIAVCGFAFYGIMALFGNTWDLVKEFSENVKVLVLFLIGFIWTVATLDVPLTMCARARLEQALSHHATRLVLLGITLHMLFNVSLMLPRNVWVSWVTSKMNLWSLVAFVFLLILAVIGHGALWIQGSVYGEVEEKPRQENGNNTESS